MENRSESRYMIVKTGKTGPILQEVLNPKSMSVDARPGGFTTGAAESVLRTVKELHDAGYELKFGEDVHSETRRMVESAITRKA